MSNLYRKRPVVIEARQLTDASMWEIYDWIEPDVDEWCWDNDEKYIVIRTLEGRIKATENDWIIKGIKGEFYPCKPEIFEATYERVGDENE